MSRPENIPPDIWQAGIAAVGYRRQPTSSSGLYLVRNVCQALLAERNRSAGQAEALINERLYSRGLLASWSTGPMIAKAIREGNT